MPEVANLLAELPADLPEELVEVLVDAESFRLEHIVSDGQASPPGFWYDQPEHEWVLLVSGSAGLTFADREGTVVLKPGDHLLIPAGTRHRVEWTDPQEKTVWLALHYR